MEKNKYFQDIRGICILAVILIHLMTKQEEEFLNSVNIILRTILNFCVGIFIFLSGYFMNIDKVKKNSKKWVANRLRRIGIPFLIFSILAATIQMIRNKDTIIKYVIHIVLGTSSTQLYYIVVLVQLILITPFLIKIIQSKNLYTKSIVIIITPIYLGIIAIFNIKFNIKIPQYQTLFLAWILYYYIGLFYKINKEKIDKGKDNIEKTLFLGWGILVCIISLMNIYMYKKGINYFYLISQVRLLNMVYILYVIVVIVRLKNKIKNVKCLEKLGDLSFGIYFIHTYIIIVYSRIFNINNYYVYISLGLVWVTFISYFSISIFKKITKNRFNKILGF